MNDYLVEVFWSDEDDAFVAVVPDLPGCSAVGDTREEAMREIADAMAAWVEARRASGEPLPAPTANPQHVAIA